MPTYSPIVEQTEDAFLAFLNAQVLPLALADFSIQPGRNYETRPVPCLIVNGAESKEREKAARGVFDVELELIVITTIGEGAGADPEAVAHTAACGAAITLINGKAGVKSAINVAGSYRLYDYTLKGSPRRINQGGEWETFISLNVVCQQCNS